jgi:hypothetical protein
MDMGSPVDFAHKLPFALLDTIDTLITYVDRASRASNSAEVQKNADGSVDLYFGPKAPAGKESNWVPTDPARQFELMLRLLCPHQGALRQEMDAGRRREGKMTELTCVHREGPWHPADGDQQMLEWTAAGDGARFMGIGRHTGSAREWACDVNPPSAASTRPWTRRRRKAGP